MDGRNSFGGRISLLNDDQPEWPVPSLRHGSLPFHSRASSFASVPSSNSSPSTPQLIRSDFADSGDVTNMQRTPSPLTPTLAYDTPSIVAQKFSETMPYGSSSEQILEYSVRYPDSESLEGQKRPMYAATINQQHPASPKQESRSTSRRSSTSNNTNSKCAMSKKNHYPCPLARQYECHDYFTTSGHAARHAKKHTGRKDAFCPECNKAFTRKDNMEQHRRTHQNGRKALKEHSLDSISSKRPKQQVRRPKPQPIQAANSSRGNSGSTITSSDGEAARQPSGYAYPDPSQAMSQQLPAAYPNPSVSPYVGYSAASMAALDTLAMAASSESLRHPVGY